MLHKFMLPSDRHAAHSFEYASEAARLDAGGFALGDVGKVALQLNDFTHWVLTGIGPITWRIMGSLPYVHPATHPASIIEQDASNRFVSDAQVAAWDGKQPAGDYATNAALQSTNDAVIALQAADTTHAGQITALQDAVATKQPAGDYATNAQVAAALAPLQATDSTQAGQITALQDAIAAHDTALAGKQAAGDYATNAQVAAALGAVEMVAKLGVGGYLADLESLTGTARWYPHKTITVKRFYFALGLVPASQAQLDLKKNGASILGGTLPTCQAGQHKSDTATLSVVVTPDDYLTVDVVAASGGDLSACIVYT